jgi:hypothetical protein
MINPVVPGIPIELYDCSQEQVKKPGNKKYTKRHGNLINNNHNPCKTLFSARDNSAGPDGDFPEQDTKIRSGRDIKTNSTDFIFMPFSLF